MSSLPLNTGKLNPTENGIIYRLDKAKATPGANGIGLAYAQRPLADWRLLLALRIGRGQCHA